MRASRILTILGVFMTLVVISLAYQLIVTMGQLEWEAGREEGLVETIGVFGLGGLLLALVALLGLAGIFWGRRGPRAAVWLGILPGIIGLLVAVGVGATFALNNGDEGDMAAVVPVAFAVGPLFLFLGGVLARRKSKFVSHVRGHQEGAPREEGNAAEPEEVG